MTRVRELFGNVQRDLQVLVDQHIEGMPRVRLLGWDAKARWGHQRGEETFCAVYNLMLGLGGTAKPGVALEVAITQFVGSGDVELTVSPLKSCEGTEMAHIDLLRPVAEGLFRELQAYVRSNHAQVNARGYDPRRITAESYKGLSSGQSVADAAPAAAIMGST